MILIFLNFFNFRFYFIRKYVLIHKAFFNFPIFIITVAINKLQIKKVLNRSRIYYLN